MEDLKGKCMKISQEELQEIFEGDHEDFETIESQGWDDQGKYQFKYPVVKHCKTGKFYTFCVQRSGSYFTDYNYYYPCSELQEVELQEKTVVVKEWVVINKTIQST